MTTETDRPNIGMAMAAAEMSDATLDITIGDGTGTGAGAGAGVGVGVRAICASVTNIIIANTMSATKDRFIVWIIKWIEEFGTIRPAGGIDGIYRQIYEWWGLNYKLEGKKFFRNKC